MAAAASLLRLMLVMMLMPGAQCKRKRKNNDKKKKNELERVLQAAEKGDLYEVLGVKRDASAKALDDARKRAALAVHPDKHRADPQTYAAANSAFDYVQDAYELLSTPLARAQYDQQLLHRDAEMAHQRQMMREQRLGRARAYFDRSLRAARLAWAHKLKFFFAWLLIATLRA